MKSRTLFTALAGAILAGSLALTGCTSIAEAPNDSAEKSAAASFLACLTAANVEARINDSGQVLVAVPPQSINDGAISEYQGSVGFGDDEEGSSWVAAEDASYFAFTPDIQDAYAGCESEHPDFTQPLLGPEESTEQSSDPEQAAVSLAFTQCARENGFTDFADPLPQMGGIIVIPQGFTEDEFRTLATACYDSPLNFAFDGNGEGSFDLWMLLDEVENAPRS